MTLELDLPEIPAADLVALMADPHRAFRAYTRLLALGDPCERVRVAAVHALGCDRCKTDACRPAPAEVLPAAIDVLAGDPSARVRAYAAELVLAALLGRADGR